jgi:hypothetical protein
MTSTDHIEEEEEDEALITYLIRAYPGMFGFVEPDSPVKASRRYTRALSADELCWLTRL